jgi:hypothetical protein
MGGSRSFNAPNYRYGMNGQMKTDEISGSGNHYTAKFWEYDPRLMFRWNLDPKPTVGLSDYACFGNNPILNVDPNGDFKYKFGARIYQFFHGGTILRNEDPNSYKHKEWFVRPEPPQANPIPASGNMKDGYTLGEVKISTDHYDWGIGKKLEETGSRLDRVLTGTSGADNDSYQGVSGMRKGADLLDNMGDKASYVPGFGTALGKGLQIEADLINTIADFNSSEMNKTDAAVNAGKRFLLFGAGEGAGKLIDKYVKNPVSNYVVDQTVRKSLGAVKDKVIKKEKKRKLIFMEYVDKILALMVSSYLGALLFIFFGIWKLRDTTKNTKKNIYSSLQPYTSGIVAGAGSIVLGITIVVLKLLGKL